MYESWSGLGCKKNPSEIKIMKFTNIVAQTCPFINSLRSSQMKKSWDFLRGSIPEFKHPDESLSGNKPRAAERDPGLNKSPGPGPRKRKGLRYDRQIIACASYYPSQPHGSSCGTGLMVNLDCFFRVCSQTCACGPNICLKYEKWDLLGRDVLWVCFKGVNQKKVISG